MIAIFETSGGIGDGPRRHAVTSAPVHARRAVQYPTVRRTLYALAEPARVDGGPGNRARCTACDACAKICPTRCIAIMGREDGTAAVGS
jgi:formate hydrogenlyase subunit 6/NADH:ubiquinone oxidoreductase subunit I